MFWRRSTTLASLPTKWEIGMVQSQGQVVVARFRRRALTAVDRAQFPFQVNLTVEINSPDNRGLPTTRENEQLKTIEALLVETLSGPAHFVAVVTTNGIREYIWYTAEASWAVTAVANLRALTTTHSVHGTVSEDRDWAMLRNIVKSSGKRTLHRSG